MVSGLTALAGRFAASVTLAVGLAVSLMPLTLTVCSALSVVPLSVGGAPAAIAALWAAVSVCP